MTAVNPTLGPSIRRIAPAAWAGRVLSGAVGGFLALEGLARIVAGQGLVPASSGAPSIEPSLQVLIGAPLLAGAGLAVFRPGRAPGALLMLFGLAGLMAVEFAAPARSPGHILFWTYVAALLIAGLTLRDWAPTRRLVR